MYKKVAQNQELDSHSLLTGIFVRVFAMSIRKIKTRGIRSTKEKKCFSCKQMTSRRRKINEAALAGALTGGGISSVLGLATFIPYEIEERKRDNSDLGKKERLMDFIKVISVLSAISASIGAASGGTGGHLATRSRKIPEQKAKKNPRK